MISKYLLDRDGIVNQVIEREGIISSPRAIGEFFLREDFLDFSKISTEKYLLVTNNLIFQGNFLIRKS